MSVLALTLVLYMCEHFTVFRRFYLYQALLRPQPPEQPGVLLKSLLGSSILGGNCIVRHPDGRLIHTPPTCSPHNCQSSYRD